MKTLLALLLLVPSLSWGEDVYLDCSCIKEESKYNDSYIASDLVGCFNNLHPKNQSIKIKYHNNEPVELVFSISPNFTFKTLKEINDSIIKFGNIGIWKYPDGKGQTLEKFTITINRVSLDAYYKHVIHKNNLNDGEIDELMSKVDSNNWDYQIFDENWGDFVSIDYMNCKKANKQI